MKNLALAFKHSVNFVWSYYNYYSINYKKKKHFLLNCIKRASFLKMQNLLISKVYSYELINLSKP